MNYPLNAPRFMVDSNVGRLVKWLRMMGYDTVFFNGSDDSSMVAAAMDAGRVILTRDTQIMRRRVVTRGQLRAILIKSDLPEQQIQQVVRTLCLDCRYRPFALCLECNQPLLARIKPSVKDLVPPYVFRTQDQYMECPSCHRIYWQGTHWQAMHRLLEKLCSSP
jgi:uncharacterized protein with PIN domain